MSAAARSLLAAAIAVSLATAAADAAPADVAALAAFAPNNTSRDYVTRLHEGNINLNTQYGPFFIPDGQCSGVVDDALYCPGAKLATGVKVMAEDCVPYPRITLSSDLRHASVLRAAPCTGEAAVRVELACSNDAIS